MSYPTKERRKNGLKESCGELLVNERTEAPGNITLKSYKPQNYNVLRSESLALSESFTQTPCDISLLPDAEVRHCLLCLATFQEFVLTNWVIRLMITGVMYDSDAKTAAQVSLVGRLLDQVQCKTLTVARWSHV